MTCQEATPGPASAVAALAADPDADWTNRAACLAADPDELFVAGAAQHTAKRQCAGCPVRAECLIDALDHRVEWGVWGGLTERERRAVLRRHPEVRSWRSVLTRQRAVS